MIRNAVRLLWPFAFMVALWVVGGIVDPQNGAGW